MMPMKERKKSEEKKEHKKPWREYTATVEDIQNFLMDRVLLRHNPTGNRRWLPFEVESITSPREVPFDYEGVYAQAYALYREGFRFWFSREEILKLAVHNRQFETPRLEEELVQLYFRTPGQNEPGEFVSVAYALQLISANISQKLSTVALGRAFVNQGFQKKTYRNVRGYVVVRRSAEEMLSIRRLMAHGADTDTDDTGVF